MNRQPTRKKRKKSEIQRDRVLISELYQKMYSQQEIAEKLNLSQPTVSRDISQLIKDWQKSALVNIDIIKSEQLEKINILEREAWIAWEKSKGDLEKMHSEETIVEHRTKKKKYLTKQKTSGNTRHLQVIEWCIDKRCELLGLNAPVDTRNLNVNFDAETGKKIPTSFREWHLMLEGDVS